MFSRVKLEKWSFIREFPILELQTRYREEINIVWFKRDLRIQDNEAIQIINSKPKPLAIYIYSKKSAIEKYANEKLKLSDIENTLSDMGMDVKGVSEDKDPELKVEVTAERMDMVSTVGIARAIKYYRGTSKQLTEYKNDYFKIKLCKNENTHYEMINLDVLHHIPEGGILENIKQPSTYQVPGMYYPMKYEIKEDADTGDVTVSMSDFVLR